MKKIFKLTGIILGCLLLFVAAFACYINFKALPVYQAPAMVLKVDVTPERVANGQRIASMLCIQCHANSENKLTGKVLEDAPAEFGTICSKNITSHPEYGIGKWTDGDLYVMIRTGLKPNGELNVLMPKFPMMADEDVKDIIAWLRSDSYGLQASEEEAPASKLTLLSKVLMNFVFKPTQMPAAHINRPDTNNLVALGEYVVNKQIQCYACHSADFKTINEMDPVQSGGYLAGGNPMLNLKGETVYSTNLTFDKTGIADYTEDEFIRVVKEGKKRNGQMVRYPMVPHAQLTDTEVRGIYAYLQTVPKIASEKVN